MHAMRKLSARERRLREQMADSPFVMDVEVAYGSTRHLRPAGGRPPLGEYLAQLWERRHFIWREAQSKVSTQNANDRLGALWLVLRPLLDAVFYGLIFGVVLNAANGIDNYVGFIIIGVFMFQFTSAAFSGGASAIRQSKAMIRAFTFPRASIPVAILIRDVLERVPVLVVMVLAVALVPPGELPSLAWLAVPLIFALHAVMNLGILLLFARLGHAVPDVAHAVGFGLRILLYASGILFPIERFLDHPVALAIVQANPIYIVITAYRTCLLDHEPPSPDTWAALVCWAVGLLVFGFVYFWRREESYGRE